MPSVGAPTSLHANQAGLQVGEIFEKVGALKRFVDDFAAAGRNVVDLEDVLADIDTHRDGIRSCLRSEVPHAYDALSAQRRSSHRIIEIICSMLTGAILDL